MRENHYANPCPNENFLRFQVTRLSITLLIFKNFMDGVASIQSQS